MKKMNLKKWNLSSDDLLQKEQLKTVLGGACPTCTCTLTCTVGGVFYELVSPDSCTNGDAPHICYHWTNSSVASCTCP